ncbi:MAG: 16S rRNA (guanine(966)-N(2))-methyltransferase RsmD [Desulfomonilaceae bacterium]
MRIIAGRLKGLRLPSPRKQGVRPTTDRVREALFSTLGHVVEGSRVLDLFAGTGSFGFEALSRGATSVVFVDDDRQVIQTLIKTCDALQVVDQVRIVTMSADQAVGKLADSEDKFDIVFLDPPYGTEWVPKVVCNPVFTGLFTGDGLLIVEREEKAPELAIPAGFRQEFSRKYGDTLVEIFRYDGKDLSVIPLK